jgi:hypothetical protein
MKKLILSAASLLAVVAAMAQGTVDFRNGGITFATIADRLVRDVDGSALVGANFRAQLYFEPGLGNPAIDQSVRSITNAPLNFRAVSPTNALAGTWQAGGIRTLQGVDIGQGATLQVRVWDSVLGATYEAALLAFNQGAVGKIGHSQGFNFTVPPAGSPPALYYMENMRSFNVVPEPSVILLGAIGAAVLLLRRRKS